MKLKSAAGTAALNVVISLTVLTVGVFGGAAVGLVKGSSSPAAATQLVEAENRIAGFTPVEQFAADLTVSEAPAAPAAAVNATVKTVRKVVRQSSAAAVAKVPAGVSVPAVGAPKAADAAGGAQVACHSNKRLDDRKVNWLINLAAKAADANPDQASVAASVDQQLRGALGKNMCAEEAQIHISNMCADAQTKKYMTLMVKELPFFVRPMVGDPCSHDLVAAANKWLP
jgi:hypothetical protein